MPADENSKNALMRGQGVETDIKVCDESIQTKNLPTDMWKTCSRNQSCTFALIKGLITKGEIMV